MPLNQLDLRLEKALQLRRHGMEGAVFGDFLNVFNNDAAQSVLDRRSTVGQLRRRLVVRAAAAPDDRREVPVLEAWAARG